MNRAAYRPVRLSAMLERAHELATYFAAEATPQKIATTNCRHQTKTDAREYQ
jgi:hypothetical protein